jgi:sRNA-binding protein
MTHDSTWLGSTRAIRWMRLTAPVALLLACALLAGLPAAASASPPDVRGEWALTITSSAGPFHGKALITKEADAEGKFVANSMVFENVIAGTFTGTLKGSTATVKTTSAAFGPVPQGEFNSETIAVEVGAGSLGLAGSGTLILGGKESSATFTATRVKTEQQIEEQEAQEKKEREEKEARANVRGEWALTLESGPATLKGIALITKEADAENKFTAANALFEGFIPGTFVGTLKGSNTSVTVTTQSAGGFPEGKFTSSTIEVTAASNPASMTGSGELTFGGPPSSGTLTATRIKTYQQVIEQETAEREAKEKQEKEAQEAVERAAREKQEKERQEREAREAAEKAAAVKTTPLPLPIVIGNTPLLSVRLATKTLTAAGGGAVSFRLTNPNVASVHGRLKLTLKAGKALSAKHKAAGGKSSTLGEVSFSLSGNGTEAVRMKLSKSWGAQLAHSKTLHVLVTLTTQATGEAAGISKTYSLTLRAPGSAHHGKG